MTTTPMPEGGAYREDGAHELPLRMYYEDTDFSGVVYHARYLHFLERGRTEALRCAGSGQAELLDRDPPLVFAVHRLTITYHAPARMDDAVVVETRCVSVKGARMVFEQAVVRDGQPLVSAEVIVAAMTEQGRPQRIPVDLLNIMLPAVSPKTR